MPTGNKLKQLCFPGPRPTGECVESELRLTSAKKFPDNAEEGLAALAVVKAQQDLRLETEIMPNSEKTGYTTGASVPHLYPLQFRRNCSNDERLRIQRLEICATEY